MWEAFIATFVPELPFSCMSLSMHFQTGWTRQCRITVFTNHWVKSLMFLQVTWTCLAFSTCYTTVWFLSSVFSHVPSSHLYVTRSCHTACNRVAILQYGSSSGSSCDLTMRETWPRFCTWMTSHLCEFFYVSQIWLLLQSIFDTSFVSSLCGSSHVSLTYLMLRGSYQNLCPWMLFLLYK